MFSSRRDDTNYTRVYMAHVGSNGRTTKAFLLPQSFSDYYNQFGKSYNRPEFMVEPVKFAPADAAEVLSGEAQKATYTQNCK